MRIIELLYANGNKAIINVDRINSIDFGEVNEIFFHHDEWNLSVKIPLEQTEKIYNEIRNFLNGGSGCYCVKGISDD